MQGKIGSMIAKNKADDDVFSSSVTLAAYAYLQILGLKTWQKKNRVEGETIKNEGTQRNMVIAAGQSQWVR